MSALGTEFNLNQTLKPGEHLIWQGPIGFTFGTLPLVVLAFWILSGCVIWATWGSYSLTEFCPPGSARKCGAGYLVIPALFVLMALVVCFDMLERLALESGRAQGSVILTDCRLIRVSNWPWHRVRAYDYHKHSPHLVFGNVLRFGTYGVIFVHREDVDHVLLLMNDDRAGRP